MLHKQLNTHEWLELPLPIRFKLIELFNIPRSSGTLVQDNTVISDGYTYKDLAHITVEKMQKYLQLGVENFDELFIVLVKQLKNDRAAELKATLPPVIDMTQEWLRLWTEQLVKLKQSATEQGLLHHVEELVRRIFEINKIQNVQTKTNKPTNRKKAK